MLNTQLTPKIEYPLIQSIFPLEKNDENTTKRGKESHINLVGKIFIKDEFTLIINL